MAGELTVQQRATVGQSVSDCKVETSDGGTTITRSEAIQTVLRCQSMGIEPSKLAAAMVEFGVSRNDAAFATTGSSEARAAALLDGSAAFKTLDPQQQASLRAYVATKGYDNPLDRARNVLDLIALRANGTIDSAALNAVINVFTNEATAANDCIALLHTKSFRSPRVDGASVTGADKVDAQCRLLQLVTLYASTAHKASSPRSDLLRNTLDAVLRNGKVTVEFRTTGPAGKLSTTSSPPVVSLNYKELKIEPNGIGERAESLAKLAHEVNHACRAHDPDANKLPGIVGNELYAYMTEVIAAGQTPSWSHINTLKGMLRSPPYSLGAWLDSPAAAEYFSKLQFRGGILTGMPNSGIPGWNLSNEFPPARP